VNDKFVGHHIIAQVVNDTLNKRCASFVAVSFDGWSKKRTKYGRRHHQWNSHIIKDAEGPSTLGQRSVEIFSVGFNLSI
jgi:hypothetical protein